MSLSKDDFAKLLKLHEELKRILNDARHDGDRDKPLPVITDMYEIMEGKIVRMIGFHCKTMDQDSKDDAMRHFLTGHLLPAMFKPEWVNRIWFTPDLVILKRFVLGAKRDVLGDRVVFGPRRIQEDGARPRREPYEEHREFSYEHTHQRFIDLALDLPVLLDGRPDLQELVNMILEFPGRVNWTDIKTHLEISDYKLSKLRNALSGRLRPYYPEFFEDE